MIIGVIASSGYGLSEQVQLPRGESRKALGFDMTFNGMQRDHEGKDHAIIAVVAPERSFTANAKFYWSDYNQGYMKKPHIERFLTHDIYISPLEMVGEDQTQTASALWLSKGETRQVNLVTLSIGVALSNNRNFADPREVVAVASEMKTVAKSQPGSYVAMDRRSGV